MVKHHSSNSKRNNTNNNNSTSNNKAYYILCILILVVLVIYIVNKNTELFIDSTYGMPVSDMHFISDNNKKLIDVPVFNYKLMVIKSNIKNDIKTTTTQPQLMNLQITHPQIMQSQPNIEPHLHSIRTQPQLTQPQLTQLQITQPQLEQLEQLEQIEQQEQQQPQPTNMPSQTTKYSNIQNLETFINTNTNTNTDTNTNTNTNIKNKNTNNHTNNHNIQEQQQAQEQIKLLLPEKKQLKYLSVFQHKPFDKYKGIGQTVILTDEPFNNMSSAIDSVIDRKCLNYVSSSSVMPLGFTLVWTSDINADNKIFSVWAPIAPSGYVSLGDIIVMGVETPPLDICACYQLSLVEKTALSNGILWSAINDMGKMCYCWGIGTLSAFKTSNQYNSNMPELQNVYNLSSASLKRNLLGSDTTEPIPGILNTSNTTYKKNIGGITL